MLSTNNKLPVSSRPPLLDSSTVTSNDETVVHSNCTGRQFEANPHRPNDDDGTTYRRLSTFNFNAKDSAPPNTIPKKSFKRSRFTSNDPITRQKFDNAPQTNG